MSTVIAPVKTRSIMPAQVGTRGCYRIIVEIEKAPYDYSGTRKGFAQVVTLCRMLQKAKADYTVSWDTPETGVLILFTIARKVAKVVKVRARAPRIAVCPAPERPTADKIRSAIAVQREMLQDMVANRRRALQPTELTHASAAQGAEWHTNRVRRQTIGHSVAKWIAIDDPRDYATLDSIFGCAVRRASQLPSRWNGDYHAYVIAQARSGQRDYGFRAGYSCMPAAGAIAECIAELAYWQEMHRLTMEGE